MSIDWPRQTRELHSHHFDSTIWNDFVFRDDDIVIASYAKAGTTWTQKIVVQLLFDDDPTVSVADRSPWLELRVPPEAVKLALLQAQTHRRFVKTPLPMGVLCFSPASRKYFYVIRDGRDVLWSLYHHHRQASAIWYQTLNDRPARIGPTIDPPGEDIREYWRAGFKRDDHPFWPFWENVRSWWPIRDLSNVMLLHLADIKRHLAGKCGG